MLVECPICQAMVLDRDINCHIDAHIEQDGFSSGRLDLGFPDAVGEERESKKQRTCSSSSHAQNGQAASSSGPGAAAPSDCAVVASDDKSARTSPQDPTLGPQPPAADAQIEDGALPAASSNQATARDVLALLDAAVNSHISAGGCQRLEGLQPNEHLKAHLLGSRTQALRDVREHIAKTHCKALQLCCDVRQDIEGHRRWLEAYPSMAKPTDHDEQSARNNVRSGLEKLTRETHGKLQSFSDASEEPMQSLCKAKAAQLGMIDDVLHMLQKFRAETVLMFQECEETEQAARPATEAAAISLAPSIDCLDSFVRHLTQEVEEETAKAIQVHSQKLEELRHQQQRFVTANDCPQRNAIFAQVLEDIACTERVLKEHLDQNASHKRLLKEWVVVLESMPSQKQLTPSPQQKRSVLGRLLGRA